MKKKYPVEVTLGINPTENGREQKQYLFETVLKGEVIENEQGKKQICIDFAKCSVKNTISNQKMAMPSIFDTEVAIILKAISQKERKNFQELQKQSQNGLWMRWIKSDNLNYEINYLKRTFQLSERQFNKYRHSQKEVNSKKEGTNHWYFNAKIDFDIYAEIESDSETDDDLKKEKYPKLKAFTMKFSNCIIDDYRFSGQIQNNDIGVLVKTDDTYKVPICMQYKYRTGYTEFVHTPKPKKVYDKNGKIIGIQEQEFGFYKNKEKNIDFTHHAHNPYFEKSKETASNLFREIKELHRKKTLFRNSRDGGLYMPYNEALMRYRPQQVQGILINKLNEQSAIHALRFCLRLNEIDHNTNLVFCKTESRSFKLEQIKFKDLFMEISEHKLREQFPNDKWQLLRVREYFEKQQQNLSLTTN
jgi:hypothetical protein